MNQNQKLNQNPRKNEKRQISVYKFLRVAKNPQSIKVRGLYLSAPFSFALEGAIEAYTLGGYLYMWRKCSKQNGSRLKTYFVRYKLDSIKAYKDCAIIGGIV